MSNFSQFYSHESDLYNELTRRSVNPLLDGEILQINAANGTIDGLEFVAPTGAAVYLPAPDIIDHLMNPVLTTQTSITLHPTINMVGNFETTMLSAFYLAGSSISVEDIVTNGTQTTAQTLTPPLVGPQTTITITGLDRNTTYSVFMALSFSGGFYISEIETVDTAVDTAPSASIEVSNIEPSPGETVTFTLTAVDNEGDVVTQQWQFDQGSSGTFVDITGETAATYEISSYAAAMHDGDYRAVVSSPTHAPVNSNVITTTESAIPPPPTPGGGLVTIASGTLMITNSLGGNAGSGTPGDTTVNSAVFGSRYPAYGGQSVAAGAGFNMTGLTVADPLEAGVGSNFGGASSITVAQFTAAGNTITHDFPASQGSIPDNGNGFNNTMGFSGVAPTTPGVYNININLASGETGFYQLEVGGGGTTTTFETPITLVTQGSASLFANAFIGLPGGTTQAFTLGPATMDTSADCFIAITLPTDLATVAVTLTPATANVSFGYVGFSGAVRWFAFRGVPSDLGTAAHTLTVDGVDPGTGPPVISSFSGNITGTTAASSATTVDLTFTIGAIGGSAITQVTFSGGGTVTTLTVPVGGWAVGTYNFTGLAATTRSDGGAVLAFMTATNSDGTFTTITTTFIA